MGWRGILEGVPTFSCSRPETAVPIPWERCYDIRSGLLMYKNQSEGSVVIDLRSYVELGGGLYHSSTLWRELVTNSALMNLGPGNSQHRQQQQEAAENSNSPYMIQAACCGPKVYLLAPELVHDCPICFFPIFFLN